MIIFIIQKCTYVSVLCVRGVYSDSDIILVEMTLKLYKTHHQITRISKL